MFWSLKKIDKLHKMLIYITIYHWGQSNNTDHVKLRDKLSKEATSSTPKLLVILRIVFQKIKIRSCRRYIYTAFCEKLAFIYLFI